ncbi:MAG: SDR family NAD(P)-dependent oxidoreductase [Propioniciclava sp.]
MSDFTGRSVLITGGAGTIGSTAAAAFLDAGAKVAIVDLSQDALDAAAQEIREHGEVLTIAANVTDEADVAGYVAKTVEAHGGIDVFFNNAGIEGKVQPIPEIERTDFEKVMAVNVTGVYLGLKHVLPVMYQAGSGSVINTSSVAGLGGSAGVAPYVASKHAVIGLTKTAALEAAGHGVRVNSIHPSPVTGRMMESLEAGFNPDDPAGVRPALAAAIPMGRYAEPQDIVDVVLFLASDQSGFVTGAQMRVDGGMAAS